MAKTPGGFRATLLIGWVALGAAGLLYARAKGIPDWAALPALAAFLVEYPFYLATGFPAMREKLGGIRLPLFALAGALLPYLAAASGAIPFQWMSVVRLAAMALAIALWYLVLPPRPVLDLAFLALVASVLLGRYLDPIYPRPFPKVDLVLLGHLALLQTAVVALIVARKVPETGYGFLPARREWRIGVEHFLLFAAVGVPLALALKVVRFAGPRQLWVAPVTFLGVLWVVALSEEFFFRGVLQRWLEAWTASRLGALALASLLFGAVHLWFRGFPNWRMALVASVLGLACGMARNRAGSIRAGMVTHALVVAAWRWLFA
jgi:membrane protease YdiL (CAAX protease family)